MSNTLYVVHCIDTEGPLHEDLSATFERINNTFGVNLKPSINTLKKLQNKSLKINGLEKEISNFASNKLLNYNKNWEDIDEMLNELLSKNFRNHILDSFGNGWIYNWHCMDHVGFKDNPRKRKLGFHKIFDHYKKKINETGSIEDGIHFHHHPIPFFKQANIPATHFFSHKPIIYEILCRKIIERQWFPCVNRPGFHSTRPDSHWFLEQFIPFDIANQSTTENYSKQRDLANGRLGDWRRAPKTWEPYHPSHDDYQKEGSCRRWICKSLNLGTRARLLREKDVRQAFKETSNGKSVILSFNHHDYRDMRPDVIKIRDMISKISKEYPKVKFRFCEAREGIRRALKLKRKKHIAFKVMLREDKLELSTINPIFGPQPFLAFKTKKGKYFHDNFDFQRPFYKWSYVFDNQTIPLNSIDTIGVGACDSTGNVTVININPKTKKFKQFHI